MTPNTRKYETNPLVGHTLPGPPVKSKTAPLPVRPGFLPIRRRLERSALTRSPGLLAAVGEKVRDVVFGPCTAGVGSKTAEEQVSGTCSPDFLDTSQHTASLRGIITC